MKKFLADESLNGEIFRVLVGRLPELDILRVQDTEMYGASDPVLLEWAAEQDRILITQDKRTMPAYTYDRVREGKLVVGVVYVSRSITVKQAAEELHLLIATNRDDEWENKVLWIPIN